MTRTDPTETRESLPSTPDTVAILAFPDAEPHATPARAGVLDKLARVARYKRNPRPPAYMRMLVASMLPHARIVEVERQVPPSRLAGARHIVLLWPDAIGYAWTPIERAIFRAKAPGAAVYALTGRRRTFRLTAGTLLGLRMRRVAERFWLGEALLAFSLLISAPFLVVWDFARGHR